MRTSLPFTAALLAGLAAITGCAEPQPACTLIGAESGIVVDYSDVAARAQGGRLEVSACVESKCTDVRVDARGSYFRLVIGGAVLDAQHGAPVDVSLSVREPGANVVFSGHTTLTPTKLQPNGTGCPPTVWGGSVVASGAHDLKVRNETDGRGPKV